MAIAVAVVAVVEAVMVIMTYHDDIMHIALLHWRQRFDQRRLYN